MISKLLVCLGDLFFRLALPLSILLGWHLVTLTGIASPLLLPSIADTTKAVYTLYSNGTFVFDVQMTGIRFFAGYLIAVVVGIPVGLLIGSFSKLHRFSDQAHTELDHIRFIPESPSISYVFQDYHATLFPGTYIHS